MILKEVVDNALDAGARDVQPYCPSARTRPRMLSSTITLPTKIMSGRSGIVFVA